MDRRRAPAPTALAVTGFTLIELIIAVAVLAILVAIATPSFTEISLRNRSTSTVNSLVADLALARSEAVKRARDAYVTANGTWNQGWQVWVDDNGNGVRDAPAEPVLKEGGPVNPADMGPASRFTLAAVTGLSGGGSAAGQIGFGIMGEIIGPPTGARFSLCRPDADAVQSVGIQVELSGRAASARDLTTLGLSC